MFFACLYSIIGSCWTCFVKLKHIVANISVNKITNWKSSEGAEILKLGLNEIGPTDIIKWWTHWLKISENTLIDLNKIF